jgi:DNA replication and repair protein RecF
MFIERLSLRSFRSYDEIELSFPNGLNLITGRNGSGKTNLLEAVSYLATLRSFRAAPNEALPQLGADRAVIRAQMINGPRAVLIETEVVPAGRARTMVNKQNLKRRADLAEVITVSVFSPEDLVLVKGGPAERRNWLDEALTSLHPRFGALCDDVEKILKQRNALLKQVATIGKGRLDESAALTLDVWDTKLGEAGTALVQARTSLLDRLEPMLIDSYADIAEQPLKLSARYVSAWWEAPGGLTTALEAGRADDVRRGLSLVGPHRDDVALHLEAGTLNRPSRTHASQGEQRTLALAMRLSVHRLVTADVGQAPILLLDDVFSELDPFRSAALVRHLPMGQAFLATATGAPPGVSVAGTVEVRRTDGVSRITTGDNPVESVDEFASERVK